jgi:hypothetical protein
VTCTAAKGSQMQLAVSDPAFSVICMRDFLLEFLRFVRVWRVRRKAKNGKPTSAIFVRCQSADRGSLRATA